MKKIMILAASTVMAFTIVNTAFASEAATLKDCAGITPDSILYPADKAIDNIKIILSFSDGAKADTLSDIAEERLGESEIMADKNSQNLANTAIDAYKICMKNAESKIENALNSSQNTENTDKRKNLENIEDKIISREKKSLDILTKLQNKVGDNAKAVIAKVIEMQKAKINAMLAVKKERAIYNDVKKQYTEAKIALEKAKKSGDETAVKSAEDLLDQKQQALNTEKQNLVKAVQAKKEASKISVGKSIKEAKAHKDKNLKYNKNKQPYKPYKTYKTNTAATASTAAGNTATGSTSSNSAAVNSAKANPISAASKNVEKRQINHQVKQQIKPVVKNQIKKETNSNINKKEKQNKVVNNSSKQKIMRSQH
ncbi:DUF5667 domain-containing protein [Clostridium luticellarii]|uniref:DUF5667 domain-containing protein n=1 Tax=Clostridium luticellarii TaxID=1691940 RepID=UPI00235519D3|nr:DUF5667 domain-containing protein [Clostridium luticellarii]MCI1943999.1 DUF5667 domain-containing protein [Clostridium luticellarii]MCI1967359.1 DUF5667 domain-containing protein [Clostridium luticellarii]